MKKLIFVFAAFTAISFASCGNLVKSDKADTDTVAVDSVDSVDSAEIDTTLCLD